MKKVILKALAVWMAVILVGCGQSAEPMQSSSVPSSASTDAGNSTTLGQSENASSEMHVQSGQELSQEELDELWDQLGFGQSVWWCADDENVMWGGLVWPAFWVSHQEGYSVKYGSAGGSGVTTLILEKAEHDGTGGYTLSFSGYVRDDGTVGSLEGEGPVLALHPDSADTLTASMTGDGFDGVPHTHTLTQNEAVAQLENYAA